MELIQYDVVNAFVYINILYDVFMKMPDGYTKKGRILRLRKALYGLRESLLLWQKDFITTLKNLSCELVPYKPCCWIKDGIIIFFYVNDIVVTFKKGSC